MKFDLIRLPPRRRRILVAFFFFGAGFAVAETALGVEILFNPYTLAGVFLVMLATMLAPITQDERTRRA